MARDSWLQRVLACEVTGTTLATHRLSVSINEEAQAELEEGDFGKRILHRSQEQAHQ